MTWRTPLPSNAPALYTSLGRQRTHTSQGMNVGLPQSHSPSSSSSQYQSTKFLKISILKLFSQVTPVPDHFHTHISPVFGKLATKEEKLSGSPGVPVLCCVISFSVIQITFVAQMVFFLMVSWSYKRTHLKLKRFSIFIVVFSLPCPV